MPSDGLTVTVTGPTGDLGIALVTALERSRRVKRIIGMARRPFEPAEVGWKKTEYRQGDVLTLERNPDWWGGKANLDRVSYRVAPESATRIAMLEKGEVDFGEAVSPDLVDQVKNNPKLELVQVPGG